MSSVWTDIPELTNTGNNNRDETCGPQNEGERNQMRHHRLCLIVFGCQYMNLTKIIVGV